MANVTTDITEIREEFFAKAGTFFGLVMIMGLFGVDVGLGLTKAGAVVAGLQWEVSWLQAR